MLSKCGLYKKGSSDAAKFSSSRRRTVESRVAVAAPLPLQQAGPAGQASVLAWPGPGKVTWWPVKVAVVWRLAAVLRCAACLVALRGLLSRVLWCKGSVRILPRSCLKWWRVREAEAYASLRRLRQSSGLLTVFKEAVIRVAAEAKHIRLPSGISLQVARSVCWNITRYFPVLFIRTPLQALNPRRAGGLCFPCRAGGGGVFTPPLTRLLGHVATCGKRQSKKRQK